MHTLVRVENANCTYCLNDVRDELLSRPLVRAVTMSAVAGCIDVEHDHDDPTALTEVLSTSLHGWQVASNAEIVMVTTTAEPSDECRWHHQ
ncbi:MAG: hypothetical protein JJE52_12295 [Acidimicrobiia bacterium]|nr:hypothetical protein [Acidimicrobiia bacterium]